MTLKPVDLPDPDELFRDIPIQGPSQGPFLVAVSGGSDSIALLLLANAWAQKKKIDLQAVTIDHGLRPEAAAEAAFVAGVCNGLNIPHLTLAWEGIKPTFGIQEAARNSRYNLLDDFAHEIGARAILTGHTKDDQAETVIMRSLRLPKHRDENPGDGRGLSGMSRKTRLYGGVSVFRPLLGMTRESLRRYLIGAAQTWIEDPSNHDESYERVRIRKRLSKDKSLQDHVLRFSSLCARLRQYQSDAAARLLADHCKVFPGPVYTLDPVFARPDGSGSAHGITCLVVQVLIAMAGGQLHFVARNRLGPVLSMLSSAGGVSSKNAEAVKRLTLGGAVVEFGKDGLFFYRETRNLTPVLLEPGEAAIWDGRMHVYNGSGQPVFVEPAGRNQIRDFETAFGIRYPVKPRAALWSTPIMHVQTGDESGLPFLPLVDTKAGPKGVEYRLASPCIEHFCPHYDESLRNWVRSLDHYSAASLQP